MNFKKYHVSRNLINSDKLERGYLNTLGDVSAQDSTYLELTSDFIPVTETNYSWSLSEGWGNISGWVARCFYNESKGMIGTRLGGRTSETSGSFQIPSGTAYIRISWRSYGTISLMLNTGSSPLPYEPYSSEVWHDTPHYIHKADTDILTTLPAVVYANGTTATVGLKGQTVQSSIPSPTSPVMPQGTGERTGNLLNFNALKSASSGRMPNSTYTFEHLLIISVEPNTAYTLSSTGTGDTGGGAADNRSLYINGTGDNEVVFANHPITKTTGADGLLYVGFESSRPNAAQYLNGTAVIMLNTGSTPLPYENFGYKIPISSANTTTPIYLGEVETTRNIVKNVFTGSEIWYPNGSKFIWLTGSTAVPGAGLCSHFNYGSTTIDGNFQIYLNAQQYIAFEFRCNSITSLTDFKQWLADQYVAGTPVTVWYRRSTPLETTLNEPLRKIGDYADEVSGISIPTIAGANTISVDTTLQPSEVTVNYKGWHPVADVHERDNGAWT